MPPVCAEEGQCDQSNGRHGENRTEFACDVSTNREADTARREATRSPLPPLPAKPPEPPLPPYPREPPLHTETRKEMILKRLARGRSVNERQETHRPDRPAQVTCGSTNTAKAKPKQNKVQTCRGSPGANRTPLAPAGAHPDHQIQADGVRQKAEDEVRWTNEFNSHASAGLSERQERTLASTSTRT